MEFDPNYIRQLYSISEQHVIYSKERLDNMLFKIQNIVKSWRYTDSYYITVPTCYQTFSISSTACKKTRLGLSNNKEMEDENEELECWDQNTIHMKRNNLDKFDYIIQHEFHSDYKGRVFAKYGNCSVSNESLKTLRPGKMVTDDILIYQITPFML